jgi:hypothetical protein
LPIIIEGIMGMVGAKPYWGWAMVGYCMALLSSICQGYGSAETNVMEPIADGMAGLA